MGSPAGPRSPCALRKQTGVWERRKQHFFIACERRIKHKPSELWADFCVKDPLVHLVTARSHQLLSFTPGKPWPSFVTEHLLCLNWSVMCFQWQIWAVFLNIVEVPSPASGLGQERHLVRDTERVNGREFALLQALTGEHLCRGEQKDRVSPAVCWRVPCIRISGGSD